MELNRISSPFMLHNQLGVQNQPLKTPAEAGETFKAALTEAVQEVNELQNVSAMKTEQLARGEIDNLHDVMITGQKASVALQATVEIRNKVIESYQEIMRMQV
ncbi:flagellar hook-basal body protein FliE [Alkalihalophilus pseudofirmus OF4]|jgi:flagellar hook-basal body complex protein FliE|uniref:Flagellar hook-basal body complex protein FliE n=3 Tax=Alkalihalophilus TaxID=2893060 RepID=D3FT41_ALKPO|nr:MULTISPECIES: flagellar hook-basal body complex protein FliE [Alkalihalophilus]ADC48109.1 flagellar hook-basal body protein FliE [Alkalihalophilus pseudofirmus OF4]ERN53139.1 flagellar hook-basal body protein FliE [Alkalihalophilus marmarensis DSM 21297]MCM3489585.1 flagellar hook-basal body complex protein FliE [Alkalihalophilus marmarensis]MDV2885278.1 flagellar hook-basal body complex protein FliE [Alkalihalophilus pseudofirmus]MED1602284.1 flagellar hook-basal body complex protein FliE 